MKVEPVASYPKPSYPTRAELDAHPEILRRLPRRWQANPLVLAAVASAWFLVPGCGPGQGHAQEPPAGTGSPPVVASVVPPIVPSPPAKSASMVAPLFVHGEGVGSFGCVAVNPPVFLTEEEARAVVLDEAANSGISFSADSKTLLGVDLPVTDQFAFLAEGGAGAAPKTSKGKFVLDGTDAARAISYEYVSMIDFDAWEVKDSGYMATVSSYDMIGAASTLRDGLAAAEPDGAYGVFYEPAESAPMTAQQQYSWDPDAGKRIGERSLRAQVSDFVDWLKAQGVI